MQSPNKMPQCAAVTELNWHNLVYDELTNRRAGRAHLSLVDAYVRVVTWSPTLLDNA